MLFSHERYPEAKVLLWQHNKMHHCVCFFEVHQANISRDIDDSKICMFREATYDVITQLT